MAEEPSWSTDVVAVVRHPTEMMVWAPDGESPLLRCKLNDYHWFPDVEPIIKKVRDSWSIDSIVVRCLDATKDDDAHRLATAFLLVPFPGAIPGGGSWVQHARIMTQGVDDRVLSLFRTAIEDTNTPVLATRRLWETADWAETALAWVDEVLAAQGISLVGRPTQVRTWGLSTVFRFETNAGTLYLKSAARGGGSLHGKKPIRDALLFADEPRLVRELAQHFPDNTPNSIAVNLDQSWMLVGDAGQPLFELEDLGTLEVALRQHGRIQRHFAGCAADLFKMGCLDRGLARLSRQLVDLESDSAVLDRLELHEHEQFRTAMPVAQGMIAEAQTLGVPDSLVHGDLHAGNVGILADKPVFFDWTDACVSHPFVDLCTFLNDWPLLDKNPGSREHLRDAYLEEWTDFADLNSLKRSAELAQGIGMLNQAVSYQHMIPCLEEPTLAAMARGASYWIREFLSYIEAS